MDITKILSVVDHTLLNVDATWEQIQETCDDAVKFGTASVCIPPVYAAEAAAYVNGKIPVCVVVGFPNGYSTGKVKAAEALEAIESGASEIDMVINVSYLKSGRYDEILAEIQAVKAVCGKHILKVIIETCLLTEDEKIKMCEIVTASGADYIKTSTGFSTGGATLDDIRLFAKHVGENVKIKAAGGIRSIEDAENFLNLGADRLGTSAVVKLIKNQKVSGY